MAASQTTKRKVKDKTPVMEGQTEEERRILRQEQRTLYDRIGDRNVDLQDLDHDAFDEERNNNNNLFKKVRFNREVRRRAARPAGPPRARAGRRAAGAPEGSRGSAPRPGPPPQMVNDGDILVQLSEAAARAGAPTRGRARAPPERRRPPSQMKRAGKLAKNVSQYSAADIGKALSQDFTKAGGDMDWVALGAQCAGLFRAVPEASFLCGPLQKPEKEKKAAQRRKKVVDDGEEETQYETTSGFKEGAAQARFSASAVFFFIEGAPGQIAIEARHTRSPFLRFFRPDTRGTPTREFASRARRARALFAAGYPSGRAGPRTDALKATALASSERHRVIATAHPHRSKRRRRTCGSRSSTTS